jgi:O-antigen/teichoic acid export membrane protein
MEATSRTSRNYRWELLSNQIWQGLNFLSKAGFLALLTPMMLEAWGRDGYGMFALASSLLVSLAVLDCGIRSLTRLRLCEALAKQDTRDFDFALCEGLASFGLVALLAFLVALALGWAGLWSRWLNLPPDGNGLITMTVGLVGIFMLSLLALEPLAADNRISALKAVNTIGALIAIPVVGLLVWLGGSVEMATFVYFLCLTLPNLYLFVTDIWLKGRFGREWRRLRWWHVIRTLRSGGWFYATTLALVAKSHALTFIVSAVVGPAAAGTFYILLRLTEMVGVFGATSSDTSLASLASETTPGGRAENFRQGYKYALVFCLHGALVLGFLTPMLLSRWVPEEAANLPPGISWSMAAYGLAGAFSRIAVNAAMGTGMVRGAAIGNLIEAALVLISGFMLEPIFGLSGPFIGASIAAGAMLPTAWALSRNFGQTFRKTWIVPIGSEIALLIASGIALGVAWWSQFLIAGVLAVGITGLLVVYGIRRLYRVRS